MSGERKVVMANWGTMYKCARCPKKTNADAEGAAEMAQHIEDHERGRI